ncbi:MAG TPA: asparagine--tRNA ligase [Candidatus Angelobacter sp.]|jgi:asparaginyl-tRNA synthetase|nr:asparagine--tRNA ligase [Candidatus Angelobacter sp.]
MKISSVKEILRKENISNKIRTKGWIRSFRNRRFIILYDGSSIKNLQIIIDRSSFNEYFLRKMNIGTSIKVKGIIVKSPGKEQYIEIHAEEIEICGEAKKEEIQGTILQPKRHSLEKLREQSHLRFRTNIFGAIIRIRHHLSFSVHEFFHKNDFFYIHTPIITTADAEGAGKMFSVLNDFFGKQAYLSVSGQLEAETAALAFGKVYTFGPTFRAENSNTPRHLAEFWMVEPEIAFCTLKESMTLAEMFLKHLISHICKNCKEDLEYLEIYHSFEEKQKNKGKSLLDKLSIALMHPFIKLSYTEAIKILKKSNRKFIYPIHWGMDFKSEHERYLTDKYFKSPLILFDYPKIVKPFYMRLNDDERTVKAMDILFPRIGEIIGGSEREDRYDILAHRMVDCGINKKILWWYMDTRRFGSTPHSGFGMGFDRFTQFVSGMRNIRDVVPFPRTPGNAEF